MTWKPDVMLYHANCADGFGAAWAAWMRWGDDVDYLPVSYGQEPPDVAGKHVLIGDFSYKRDTMRALSQSAASVVVLDHHKTAEDELAPWCLEHSEPVDVNNIDLAIEMVGPLAIFDMQRSGAAMVWDFCHPDSPMPLLLEFIQDRDLWRFNLEMTKPFGVWLRCEPFDFARWEMIAQELADGHDGHLIFQEANAMQRFFDQKVAEIGRLARTGTVAGHAVPLCNCPPAFASEVGHWLLDQHPDAPFVACYSDQSNARGYGLRSRDDRMDVSEIARKFGGGGHRNAAGFGVPL